MRRSRLKPGKGLRSAPAASRTDPGAAARRTRPSARPAGVEEDYGARAEWKTARRGKCAVCGQRGVVLRHHVITERHVREANGDPWDLRNSMDVGAFCRCHANHHAAVRRIPLDLVPDAALTFAVDLYGDVKAAAYFVRYYHTDS